MYNITWNQPEKMLGVAQRPGPILQGITKCYIISVPVAGVASSRNFLHSRMSKKNCIQFLSVLRSSEHTRGVHVLRSPNLLFI